MTRWRILACLGAAAIAGWVAVVLWNATPAGDDSPRPIGELPGDAFVVGAEEYVDFVDLRRPIRTGWVAVPPEQTGPEFRTAANAASVGFASPTVCAECHREKYDGFVHTAHFRTSQPASRQSILGSFDAARSRLETRDRNLQFEMVDEGGKLLQRVHVVRDGKRYVHSEPFDIAVGSGNHGQGYLYWKGDRLFQLPISYLTETDRWVNSPGAYVDGTADFCRPITAGCMACHSTYVADDQDARGQNRYDRRHTIYGVTCVRCHGEATEHVAFHRANPQARTPHAIVNPSKLPRESANHVCAQCHSGIGELLKHPLAYRPGRKLEDYLQIPPASDSGSDDPHSANQLQRLKRSRCFKESQDLTCASCHNPHRQERGQTAMFSRRCFKCHQPAKCGVYPKLGKQIEARCVQCHMPSRRDHAVPIDTPGGVLAPLLRDHHIRIEPAIARAVMEQLSEPDDARRLPEK